MPPQGEQSWFPALDFGDVNTTKSIWEQSNRKSGRVLALHMADLG